MVFLIENKDGMNMFSGDFGIVTDPFCSNQNDKGKQILLLKAKNTAGFDYERYVEVNYITEILDRARNDIIHIVFKEMIDDKEIFELKNSWSTKYAKYGTTDERKNFVRENLKIPFKFIKSIEDSEEIISAVDDVLELWQNKAFNK